MCYVCICFVVLCGQIDVSALVCCGSHYTDKLAFTGINLLEAKYTVDLILCVPFNQFYFNLFIMYLQSNLC